MSSSLTRWDGEINSLAVKCDVVAGVALAGFRTSIIVVTARGGTEIALGAERAGETSRLVGGAGSFGGESYRAFFSRLSVSSLDGDDAVGRFKVEELLLLWTVVLG